MRTLAVVAVAFVATFALAGAAGASERRPTLAELEGELICPTCQTTLDQSSAPVADQMRAIIRERIRAGDTKSEIKDRLVAEFGPEVLAAPPKSGFDLLAWVLPILGLFLAAVVVGVAAWRWTRAGREALAPAAAGYGQASLDPELERRLDEELRRLD